MLSFGKIACMLVAIALNVSAGQNLVAYWSFDSTAGQTFYDVTGHGYNATYTDSNPSGSGVSVVPGVKGEAVSLPGANYEIIVANSKDSFNLQRFTIECWYFSNLLPTTYISVGGYIFDQQYVASGVRNGYGLYIDPTGRANFAMSNADGSDWLQNFSVTSLQENQWYHIVCTYDSSSMKTYINGVCEATLPYSGSYLPSGANARIGCQRLMDGTLRCFDNGKIDELKLYDYALSADTILAHYNALKPFKINLGMKPVYASPGDSIWIPVYLSNFANFNISSCQFNVQFDTSLAKMVAVSSDSGIAKGWDLIANTAKIDPVPVAMAGLSKAISYGEGELIRCRFVINPTAKQGSSTSIDLSSASIDENNIVSATIIPGKITISKPTFLYGDVSGNGEVTALDAAEILQCVVGQITLPNAQYPNFTTQVADVSGDGTISSYDAALIFQYCVGMLASFPIQNVPVLAKRTAIAKATASTEAEVSIDGPITVSPNIYQYTIHAKNLSGFIAGEFSMQCDSTVIVSIKDASALIKSANFIAQFDPVLQQYHTAITTSDEIDSADVDLFTVTVQQKAGVAASGMTIKNALFNEGRIPTTIVAGSVLVRQPATVESMSKGICFKENTISIDNCNQDVVSVHIYDMAGRTLFSKAFARDQKSITMKSPVQSGGIFLWKIARGSTTMAFRVPAIIR